MQRNMEFKKTEILFLVGSVQDDKAYTKTVAGVQTSGNSQRWPGTQTLCTAKCAQTHSHAQFFSVVALRGTSDALRTLQHFYGSRSV